MEPIGDNTERKDRNLGGKCSNRYVKESVQVKPIEKKTSARLNKLSYAVQIHIMMSKMFINTLRQ